MRSVHVTKTVDIGGEPNDAPWGNKIRAEVIVRYPDSATPQQIFNTLVDALYSATDDLGVQLKAAHAL